MTASDRLPIPFNPQPGRALTRAVAFPTPAPRPGEQARSGVAVLRRRWGTFLAIFLAVFGAVAIYTFSLTPQYQAVATLLVNSRMLNVTAKDNDIVPQATDEDRAVNAEIQILQSTDVAQRVIAALTAGPIPDLGTRLTELPPAAAGPALLDTVNSRLRVERPGNTNVLGINFTAGDPMVAAAVANEFARQYIASKNDARLSAARGADGSLRKELDTMRRRVEQAEQAVADYRRANNLLSADGVTLTEQEQSLYKQQDAAAQTALAEERARLGTARRQLSRGSLGDDVGEALGSSVVGGLRAQRAQASAKLAELTARYQPGHPKVVNAREELADVDRAISAEIRRVISNLEARVSVAEQKAGAARGIAGSARAQLATNAGATVRLNELERRAEALRTNYAGMLQRQTAVASQAVVADADARILSQALVPKRPATPNRKLNLALGALLALVLATAAVIVRQLLDQRMISSREIERELGLQHLVNVPSVASIATRQQRRMAAIDYIFAQPLSLLAESMRSLLHLVEARAQGDGAQIVGIVSARQGEGKSTTAACLARVAAASGRRTLLIDGDARRPSIATMFDKAPSRGLREVLAGSVPLKEALIKDEASGAWLLPTLGQPFAHAPLGSDEALRSLMTQCQGVFDLVIIDTAPALAAVESRMLMAYVDLTLLVVRWKHTPAPVARTAIKRLQSAGKPPLGVVVTHVDMKAIAAYVPDDVDHEHHSWAAYGY